MSEFDCQGLEIDMPVVGWGNDMLWDGHVWKSLNQMKV
ncbi:DNA/RNA helicase domain-containing protein [Clostridium sp. MB40-C1]